MIIKNLLLGIALIIAGIWIAIVQIRKMQANSANTLGGISGLLIIGIGCVICGIISLLQTI